MPISWNEIRHNAIRFSSQWAGATSESAEKQTFWNEFFEVFGLKRRLVATFEEPVKKIAGQYGYIDLLWPGKLLVEHKSFGQNLGKAESQAFDYVRQLANEDRLDEIPRYIIVSDFARIALHDLEPEEQRDLPLFDKKRGVTHEFPLADFHRHIHEFAFIPGYKQHTFKEQDPINIEAVQIMGELHDALKHGGYTGHDLERFLVRILFCLFAQCTGIFEPESFRLFIENRTAPDGSDLGEKLARLFEVLNTPPERRQKNLDETLVAFPYVNGELFNEHLGFADFNRDMRNALLACTRKDWSRISPAIFGSLFQSIMDDKKRRQIGAHYTSERDILKVIRSLFLDDLRSEFENRRADRSTGRRARLEEFHDKLCQLRFLDPACGCGNFLVIGYRELRQLELETLKQIFGKQTELTLDEITKLSQVDVDQFYGIEIGEWPVRIAEVALWLMDHQMNMKISEAFGQLYQRLPLKKSPTIICGNALRLDWKAILPPEKCSYVLGNPPFSGKKEQNAAQKEDMDLVWDGVKGVGVLDYVTAWYVKAARYIKDTCIPVAFVSTNSITQGEQVCILWRELFERYALTIRFAHRTFSWQSEARGKAHVHVVIIGFGRVPPPSRVIYEYNDPKGEPVAITASNINAYLLEGPSIVVEKRMHPISPVPEMDFGSKAADFGHLVLSAKESADLAASYPMASQWIRPFLGSEEFINGIERFCLWLKDANPAELRKCAPVLLRIEKCREERLKSVDANTRRWAEFPALFQADRQPDTDYLVVPKVSSERRRYVPLGFMPPTYITNPSILVVPNATLYHFGVLSAAMHMAWMRQICGRMKSDYQYSNTIVYNNFPWPNASADQRKRVQEQARDVLAARKPHLPPLGLGTLADIYDPLTMPPGLSKAHADLDRAVEKCYRSEAFHSDRERVEFLFSLYEKLTAPLLPATPKTRGRRSQTTAATPRPTRQRTPALPAQKVPPRA